MKFSLSKHGQFRPAWVDLGENIMKILTKLNFILQIILLAGIVHTNTVAVVLHQVPLGGGQEEVVLVEDDSGVVLDELLVLFKVSAVGDVVQLSLHMSHNLFNLITISQS